MFTRVRRPSALTQVLTPYAGDPEARRRRSHPRSLGQVPGLLSRGGRGAEAALLGAAVAAAAATPLGLVLLFAAGFTIAGTAHRPAQAALMPKLARTPAELAAAKLCWSATDYAGFLLGSLLAGSLVGIIGLDVAFAACAAAFGITALVVRGLPADPRPPALEERVGGLAELSAGVRTVRAHPKIRLLVGVYAVNALVQGVFDVLIVVAAIELLGCVRGPAGSGSA